MIETAGFWCVAVRAFVFLADVSRRRFGGAALLLWRGVWAFAVSAFRASRCFLASVFPALLSSCGVLVSAA